MKNVCNGRVLVKSMWEFGLNINGILGWPQIDRKKVKEKKMKKNKHSKIYFFKCVYFVYFFRLV